MAKRGARVGAARRGAAAAAIEEEAQLTQVQKAVFERSGLPTPQLLPASSNGSKRSTAHGRPPAPAAAADDFSLQRPDFASIVRECDNVII